MSTPIFLQALWRTGSTYLWGKFREKSDLRCYFEPFHESLFCKTREKLREDFERASKKFGHNSITHNYYDEYPIQPAGGVPLFKRRFTWENFVLEPQQEDHELVAYIDSLIDLAAARHQRAVLQFNRGTLRAEWMKQQFGGTHIYLNRNPSDMLYSYRNNKYYIPAYLGIIGQNADSPLFAEIADHFGVSKYNYAETVGPTERTQDSLDSSSFRATFMHFSRKCRLLKPEDERDMVAFFWTTALAHATRYADVIVDTEQSIEPEGLKMHDLLKETTGIDFDFSDFKLNLGDRRFLPTSDRMKSIIQNAVHQLNPEWENLKKFPMSRSTLSQTQDIMGHTLGLPRQSAH